MYRDTPKKVPPTANSIVRTKAMKTLEETYGVKYENPVSVKMNQKSQIKCSVAAPNNAFKDRGDMDYTETLETFRPNYNKYLITSSDRYGGMKANDGVLHTTRRKAVTFHSEHQNQQSSLLEQRHAEVLSKQEQYFGKVEKPPSRSVSSKPKTARGRQGNIEDLSCNFQNSNIQPLTAKKEDIFPEAENKKNRSESRHHQHKHEHQSRELISEEKDDDTEEFIGLIKRAVEKSVIKSMTEILSSTFADVSKKMDRQAAEIKKLTTLVQKLHNNLGNKISHYGEENSRHFRYLCMKSEYDKMFYQHHNQMTVKSAPVTPPTPNKAQVPVTTRTILNTGKSCSAQSARTLVPDQELQQPQNMTLSKKTMDDGMRDMVSQLKRFCLQYESSVILEEDLANKSGTSVSSGLRLDNAYHSRVHLFQDDDTTVSSDGMTPRSVEHVLNAIDIKRSKTSLATETLNSLNESSIGGGDA